MAYLEIVRSGSMRIQPSSPAGFRGQGDRHSQMEKAHLDGGPISVGRHVHNLIVLNDQDVSRHHCIIDQSGSTFTVRDLASHNGTRINGRLLEEPVNLQDGDVIAVGQTMIKFINRSLWTKLVNNS